MMNDQSISVVYTWTAKTGKGEELKAIYEQVAQQMKNTEPGALKVECNYDANKGVLVVYDLFQNAEALGFHLGVTASAHFSGLLEIATPGPFLFCGDVPDQMKQAAIGMGLQATFAPRLFGFDRAVEA